MNRIVLIGNGFDLAHGLKTAYHDFIDWYWAKRIKGLSSLNSSTDSDPLCTFSVREIVGAENSWCYKLTRLSQGQNPQEILETIEKDKKQYEVNKTIFFNCILNSIETKGWVDIEYEYFLLLKKLIKTSYTNGNDSLTLVQELNKQLTYIQEILIEYLGTITIENSIINSTIKKQIYSHIKSEDIAVSRLNDFEAFVESEKTNWEVKIKQKFEAYEVPLKIAYSIFAGCKADQAGRVIEAERIWGTDGIKYFSLPDNILLLNFNYTEIADLYCKKSGNFNTIHIHGSLNDPKSVIFGYGDELDDYYKQIQEKNENIFLNNIKSIRYMESDKYREMLKFLESDLYQVYIMGHSCGNSDRTLLNKIFEHKNCVSIKPFYYKKKDGTDNYLDLVQNISRNFTDMNHYRERVVNKTFCSSLN